MYLNEELVLRVKDTIDHIYAYDYFVSQWEKVKHTQPIYEINDMNTLLKPFQDFYDKLPDSSACRRDPFFAVCDLAEEWCFGEWRERDE